MRVGYGVVRVAGATDVDDEAFEGSVVNSLSFKGVTLPTMDAPEHACAQPFSRQGREIP